MECIWLFLHLKNENCEQELNRVAEFLKSSRPTAVNLAFAVDEMLAFILANMDDAVLKEKVLSKAGELKQQEIEFGEKIGAYGWKLSKKSIKEGDRCEYF